MAEKVIWNASRCQENVLDSFRSFENVLQRAVSTLWPVSYTHLDVYKRQVLMFISTKRNETVAHHYTDNSRLALSNSSAHHQIGNDYALKISKALLGSCLYSGLQKFNFRQRKSLWRITKKTRNRLVGQRLRYERFNEVGDEAVSYTHLDVYKRQI